MDPRVQAVQGKGVEVSVAVQGKMCGGVCPDWGRGLSVVKGLMKRDRW